MTQTFLAYLALRARAPQHLERFEQFADYLLLAGLTMMSVVGVLIAYEVI